MAGNKTVKTAPKRPRLVGVIFSPADLRRAIKMRHPPDLFELRLDALASIADEVEGAIKKLKTPLLITARHPREGGMNQLSSPNRRDLLLIFLPYAAYLDIELRSARALGPVLQIARKKKVGCIISFHDLENTPSLRVLCDKARRAQRLGAHVFKVATRTDIPEQLARLLKFHGSTKTDLALAAMGFGKLGTAARRTLARQGSVLNYAHLGCPQAEGQMSLTQLREALRPVRRG